MSDTDTAYGAMGLRACYAKSGTDIAYDAMGLGACYAYGPRRLLCEVRYSHSGQERLAKAEKQCDDLKEEVGMLKRVCYAPLRYAVPGTDIASRLCAGAAAADDRAA
eukprot:811650-Rhodomonas_salina.3